MVLKVATGAVVLVACAGSRQAMAPAAPPETVAASTSQPAPVQTPPAVESTAAVTPAAAQAETTTRLDPVFESTVRPLLARHCTPCHVPGGKMYDRMPFDQPRIVQEFQAGILRRLKVPEENQAVQDWLKTASAR
jgi:hypothetical protein